MMGERRVAQEALFYEFSLERHVPADHWVRAIDRFVDLSEIRAHLRPFYSEIGRPSVDPELMIRMLLIGYCFGIRSERRLCEEVHLNLAYRWFCRLGLEGNVPDHSTFSKNRHGRFRESDLLRELFETTVRRCIAEGLVGGEGFAVDASLIKADANKQRAASQRTGRLGRSRPDASLGPGVSRHAGRGRLGRIQPCIPGRRSRNEPVRYDKRRYRRRSRIEIMFGRLKDWRRVATRYGRCPTAFFSAIALAATVIFWL